MEKNDILIKYIEKLKFFLSRPDILEDITVTFQDKFGRLKTNSDEDLKRFIHNYADECPIDFVKTRLIQLSSNTNGFFSLDIKNSDFDWEVQIVSTLLDITLKLLYEKIKPIRKNSL